MKLKEKIYVKTRHKKMWDFDAEKIDLKESSRWIKKSNIPATEEAKLVYIQDRNLFIPD